MFSLFEKYGLLDVSDIEAFVALGKKKSLRKGQFFIQEGEVCNTIAFIRSGVIRSFYLSPNGDDNTYCFILPNQLLGAYSSYITSTPTHENMQALTDVELMVFSKSDVEALAHSHLNWLRMLRRIAEDQYLELEKRVFELQSLSALERYEMLIHRKPELIKTIPLQYIASYLGVTQRHLSRLRNEISI